MNRDPEAGREAHLRDYWRTVWSGRWTLAAVFIIVTGIGIAATLIQTRIYRATATLEIHPRSQRVVRVDDVSQIGATGLGWSAEDRYLKTQLEILKSRAVAGRAFEALGLSDHPDFRTRDPIRRFMSLIELTPTPDTLIVAVSMEGDDPDEVSAWTNAVVDAYVQRNLEEANEATLGAVQSLITQLDPLRENLVAREEEKFRYAREKGIFVPETQRVSDQERIASLERDYTTTKLRRLELEAVFRRIEEISREGGDFTVIPQVANDAILRGLIKDRGDLEAEMRKLLVTFKEGHFKLRESEAALQKVSQRIDSETRRIISAIRTDYSLAQAREKDLEREILATKESALASSEAASTYEILQSESVEARKIYDLVAQRVKEVDLNAGLLRNNITILDRAIVPKVPVRPRRVLNLAVSMLMGLGLGVGMVFFLEYLDNTVRDTTALDREFGLRTLAVVPRRRPETEAAVAEAFSALRTGVQFSSMNRARRVILVTSAGSEDGKTLAALSLARAMIRAGDRVCLVDGDLRRPALHERLRRDVEPGLTNLLAGEGAGLREAVRAGGAGQPDLVPSGPIPPSPAELIASERFGALIKELKGNYDWVVVDSPPAAGLTDSVLLAAQCDMVVVVVRQARSDRDVLRRALDAIRTANPNIIGAVLNDVDLSRSENRRLYYPTYDLRRQKATVRAARLKNPAAL